MKKNPFIGMLVSLHDSAITSAETEKAVSGAGF